MAHTYGTGTRWSTTDAELTTANPYTQNFTCGSGDTVLVVAIIYAGTTARTGGAPTYNGTALTQAGSTISGAEATCELWYLLNPPTGSSLTVSIPNSNTRSMWGTIATGVAGSGKTSDLDADNSLGGQTSTNPSLTVNTTVAGDICFGVVASGAQSWGPTHSTGVAIYDDDVGAWGGGAKYLLVSGTGTQSITWTFGTSDDWGAIAVSFKEVSAPISRNLTNATSSATGQAISLIGGAVSKSLTDASPVITGQACAISAPPSPTSINLNPAAASATGQATSLSMGESSITLDTAAANGAGQSISLSPGASAAIVLSLSDNIPAGGATATTAQLTPPAGKTSGDFQAGNISDDTNPLASIDLCAYKYDELEWSIEATAGVLTDDVYEFRVTQNGTPVHIYSQTPQLTIGSSAVSINLSVGALDATGQTMAVSAPISRDLSNASLSAQGQAASISVGASSVSVANASLAAQGQSLSVVPGARSTALNPASILASGQTTSISAPAVGNVQLDNASLSAQGQTIAITPGATAITLANGAALSQGQVFSVVSVASVALVSGSLSGAGQAVIVAEGPVSKALSAAGLSEAGQTLAVSPGAMAISLANGAIYAGGQTITITPGAFSVTFAASSLSFQGQTISVSAVELFVLLSAALMTAHGQAATLMAAVVHIANCYAIPAEDREWAVSHEDREVAIS